MTTDPAKGLIGSLLHGLSILDMFARDRPEIGIGEMAQELGLHRSTTSRLAATLAMAGYLEPAGEPGRYRLSGRLAALGELVGAEGDVRRAALPYLQDLVQNLGETGHLAVLEGTEAVTVEVVDGWQTASRPGRTGRSPTPASSSATSRRCASAVTRWTARSSSRTCAVSPGRSSTGPGRWWRASASPGPTHASMRRPSPP